MPDVSISPQELLQFVIENGMIDPALVQEQIEMQKRKELLSKHNYKIWQGNDGKWRTYLPDDAKGRKLVKRNAERDIQDAVLDYMLENTEEEKKKRISKTITLKEIFPKWIDFKQIHTNSTSYTKKITATWKKYYAGQKDFINMPLCDMTTVFLDEWAHGMIKAHGMTKKQYYNMSVILRQSLDYAVSLEYLEENVFQKVKINTKLFVRQKKKTGQSQVYTEQEEEMLAKDMIRRFNSNPKNTAPLAVIFAFETGVRIGELCALRFSDIEGSYIHIQRQEVREYEKTDDFTMRFKCYKIVDYVKSEDSFREVYLTDTARQIIEVVKSANAKNHESTEEGYIFVKNHRNINHYSMQAMILRGCNSVGMEVKTCHKIRKTYISTLIDSGLNIDAIRRFAGHSDERTTYGNYCYNRLTDRQTEEAVEHALNKCEVIRGNQIINLEKASKINDLAKTV